GLVGRHQRLVASQAASAGGGLLLHDVAAVGLAAPDPAGAGQLEALGRTAVRLHLGHGCLSCSSWQRRVPGVWAQPASELPGADGSAGCWLGRWLSRLAVAWG